jgi:hypothetical protein
MVAPSSFGIREARSGPIRRPFQALPSACERGVGSVLVGVVVVVELALQAFRD